jgi:SpoIID/LytB domain protein
MVPTISVGILSRREIRFTLSGTFHVQHDGGSFSGDYVARPAGGGITLIRDGSPVQTESEILLIPITPECSFTLYDVTIGDQFHWERNEDQQFSGMLKLVRSGEAVTAINIVDVETYLISVISSEMSPQSSLTFLKTHAIVSRSWLLAQLEKSRLAKTGTPTQASWHETATERIRWYDREDHEQFDVCADDHCQRYHGLTKASTPSVEQAVAATRGTVLRYEGRTCDARFSKCCGGVTERFDNVWESIPHPYLTSVVDARSLPEGLQMPLEDEQNAERWIRQTPSVFCNTHDQELLAHVLPSFDRETKDFFRWKVIYRQRELAELIAEKSGMDFGEILDLRARRRGSSGRIIELTIVGRKKVFTIGKELEIRRTLSPSHLYSSAFVVEKGDVRSGVPSQFVLHGAGWGHGVGLCQIGAAVMGEQGYSHENILAHYFPHTQLTTLY